MAQLLDYHKPEQPKPAARPGFRIGAGFMVTCAVASLWGARALLDHGETAGALVIGGASVAGCLMFGRIALLGRL